MNLSPCPGRTKILFENQFPGLYLFSESFVFPGEGYAHHIPEAVLLWPGWVPEVLSFCSLCKQEVSKSTHAESELTGMDVSWSWAKHVCSWNYQVWGAQNQVPKCHFSELSATRKSRLAVQTDLGMQWLQMANHLQVLVREREWKVGPRSLWLNIGLWLLFCGGFPLIWERFSCSQSALS